MIRIQTIASGSTGNCYLIENRTDVLMIECGIRFPLIRKAFGFKLSRVAGCLISHGHKDHCCALPGMLRAGVDCYITQGAFDENSKVLGSLGYENHHRLNIIKSGQTFRVGSFLVLPFDTQHDCNEPVGFLIRSGDDKLLFATDTAYIKNRFAGLTHIMIECNYYIDILAKNVKSGIVNRSLADRIIGSHFELEDVKEFIQANDLSKVEEIHLIHISEQNGNPEYFKNEIQKLTGIPVYV